MRHEFYIEQAQTRLLSKFDNIEEDANEWLKKACQNFDPDRDDEGSLHDQAHNKMLIYADMLSTMQNNTCLSVVADMFYQWEKFLKKRLLMRLGIIMQVSMLSMLFVT